jgi:hypothetical protein
VELMAYFKVAMVKESDYASLRKLIPELPQEFDRWKLQQESSAAHYQASGRRVETVEFNPNVFAEWCDSSHVSPSETSLDCWIFAGCPKAKNEASA